MNFKDYVLSESRDMTWDDTLRILSNPEQVKKNKRKLEKKMKDLRTAAESRKKSAGRRSASFTQASKMKREGKTFEMRANRIEKALEKV